jgi:cysteine protease ATG4
LPRRSDSARDHHSTTTTSAPQTAHNHLFFLFSSHLILMSSKSRNSSSPSTTANSSKLPKFLQSKQYRDRSRSMIDPASNSSRTASSSSLSEPPVPSSTTQAPKRSIMRRGSKLVGVREASSPPHDADVSEDFSAADDSTDEPPIIVEPLSPRVRMRSERPLSSVSDNHLSYYQSSHSTTRLSDIPTRLSGWFQHTFNASATDLSLPQLLNSANLPPPSSSPKTKSALLAAAKHGKGQLDKAMRYLLDSDSTPDKCTEPIWLLGLQHPGYDPSADPAPALSRRGSVDSRRASSFRTSTSSTVSSPGGGNAHSPSSSKSHAAHWSPEFFADFTSCVWITYRTNFQPIRDSSLTVLEREQAEVAAAAVTGSPNPISSSPPSKRWWPGGEKGWTSDTGWGCMLRTGQSLLATALIHLHLGRGSCPFDFPSASLTFSRLAAASPSRIYCRLLNIRPDFNVVLRLAIPAQSVQRTPYGSSWEGAWKGCWTVVRAEHRRWCDQVRKR